MKCWLQLVEMSFLDTVAGLILKNWIRNFIIWGQLKVELLLLYNNWTQLSWSWDLFRKAQNFLEGLYIPFGLGTSGNPTQRTGECC